jgi:hypothetical protein
MPNPLPTKPGINGANVLSIPTEWDATWFRRFINNSLKGADVRNAIAGPGIAITGNISSPYATISAAGGGGGVTQIVAGTGISVSPAGGTGVVTVSATGGGGGVTQIVAGTGISVSPAGGTGVVTVTNAFSPGLPTLFEGNYEQTLHLAIANASTGLFDTGTITAAGFGGGGLTVGNPTGTGTTIDALGWVGNQASGSAINTGAGFLNAQVQYSIFQSGTGNALIGNYQAGGVIQFANVPPFTGRVFFGLSKENVNPIVTTAEPSNGTNLVGFSKDSTDGNLQMLVSNGTGPGAKTSTGVSFASLVGVTLSYKIISNKTSVTLTLEDLDTQTVIFTGSASSNLPDVNVGLNFIAAANNGTSVVSTSEVRVHKFFWALPTI